MAKLDELKNVKINELNEVELTAHKQEVLSLNEEEVNDYLLSVIDNEYELSDEENASQVSKFLKEAEFKAFFEKIVATLETEETTTQTETEAAAE